MNTSDHDRHLRFAAIVRALLRSADHGVLDVVDAGAGPELVFHTRPAAVGRVETTIGDVAEALCHAAEAA